MHIFHKTALRLLVLTIAFFLAFPFMASAEGRVALLIGNSLYDRPEMSLRNPANDVTELDIALTELGFSVRKVQDADRTEMRAGLAWLAKAAKDTEMAMVFYAGHGVQVAGENYLVGRDLQSLSFDALERSSVTLSEIRKVLSESGTALGMIILDACRNNPLSDAGVGQTGLASVRGGAGLLVAYATDPGNVAYDGEGDNSAFTTGLLKNLASPHLDVRLMFGRVRQDVVRETSGRQIPWVEESVLGEHYLVSPPDSNQNSDEIVAWRDATDAGTRDALDQYLGDYPNGLFQAFATERIEQLSLDRDDGLTNVQATTQLASLDADDVRAALDLLGYVNQERGIEAQPEGLTDDIKRAFEVWRRAQLVPDTTDANMLLRDAARLSMFLAATTAQRIRTDTVIRSSIRKHLELASVDVAQIRKLALTSEEAKSFLPEVEADLDAIRQDYERVAQRLDASLTYYHKLVVSASKHFQSQIRPDLFWQNNGTSRSGLVEPSLFEDAAQFVRHVRSASSRAPGSYAWLTDFLEQG
ncbi:caspase family protein [Sulfitobacter geojensis]|uniref:Caspase family protein n=3 Tax=Sulfitobacter geojensis TaxID=1342299 RepID=A0AAE2W1R0_9RHOB|nr:caspase family protein [Sulfitobacter geojensis]MBM1691583.1 caspase family protein [Sulfitobacter geojensis]MBM1695666.1 caspase family protein [Sulfitobacter geojensis]MBM1707822.1 caspase family protein [Sulfitobacter geojensis]MBM1711879.1 caspase family protein [Sulfitobacter geojensis]MBM1715946.1 caspase family protein [Sulfitobacter geojensis]